MWWKTLIVWFMSSNWWQLHITRCVTDLWRSGMAPRNVSHDVFARKDQNTGTGIVQQCYSPIGKYCKEVWDFHPLSYYMEGQWENHWCSCRKSGQITWNSWTQRQLINMCWIFSNGWRIHVHWHIRSFRMHRRSRNGFTIATQNHRK